VTAPSERVPARWRLEIHDSLTSTNDVCIGRAETGEAAGLAVLARRQTGARGSRGRGWTEPPSGNLALSVLLRPGTALDRPGLWPFLAGLALHQALRQVSPAAVTLKWPNDVLLRGRKLAGILIERGLRADGAWLVIGFGANLAAAPLLADRSGAGRRDDRAGGAGRARSLVHDLARPGFRGAQGRMAGACPSGRHHACGSRP
jgi:BirA family biotin operon repressor/biotin-[acetyl-CoA-carboxylase] ligase